MLRKEKYVEGRAGMVPPKAESEAETRSDSSHAGRTNRVFSSEARQIYLSNL